MTTSIDFITLTVPDVDAAKAFYRTAFGDALGDRLRFAEGADTTSGFRGYVLSLVVADPVVADSFLEPALEAGATEVKPAKKSFWGYGGVIAAPDGALWKVASSKKKATGAPTRQLEDVVLLLGVDDVAATKEFVERGLAVAKSFGRKYVEFQSEPQSVTRRGQDDPSCLRDRPGARMRGAVPLGAGRRVRAAGC